MTHWIQVALLLGSFLGGVLTVRYVNVRFKRRDDFLLAIAVLFVGFFLTPPVLTQFEFGNYSVYGVFVAPLMQVKFLGAILYLTLKQYKII